MILQTIKGMSHAYVLLVTFLCVASLRTLFRGHFSVADPCVCGGWGVGGGGGGGANSLPLDMRS